MDSTTNDTTVDEAIDAMFGMVKGRGGTGQYISQLPSTVREDLESFEDWLVSEDNKAGSTAKSYKGHVAKCIVFLRDGGDINDKDVLTTDVRSAVGAYARFQEDVRDGTEDDEPVVPEIIED